MTTFESKANLLYAFAEAAYVYENENDGKQEIIEKNYLNLSAFLFYRKNYIEFTSYR